MGYGEVPLESLLNYPATSDCGIVDVPLSSSSGAGVGVLTVQIRKVSRLKLCVYISFCRRCLLNSTSVCCPIIGTVHYPLHRRWNRGTGPRFLVEGALPPPPKFFRNNTNYYNLTMENPTINSENAPKSCKYTIFHKF